MKMTLDQAEEFLTDLHNKIWKPRNTDYLKPFKCPCPGKRFKNPNKRRGLTDEELDTVFSLIEEYDLPVTIISSFNGASFSLRIYANRKGSVCRLLTIESSQFPNNGGRKQDESVCGLMLSLANSPKNLALIKEHQIKKPAERTAYRW